LILPSLADVARGVIRHCVTRLSVEITDYEAFEDDVHYGEFVIGHVYIRAFIASGDGEPDMMMIEWCGEVLRDAGARYYDYELW